MDNLAQAKVTTPTVWVITRDISKSTSVMAGNDGTSTLTMGYICSPLPDIAVPSNTVVHSFGTKKKMWESFMVDNIPSGKVLKEAFDKGVKYEGLFPKKPKKKSKSRASVSSRFNLAVSRCRRKAAKLTTPSSDAKFQTFIPLRDMWTSYIDKVIQIKSLTEKNYGIASANLMKADLHGCPIIVQKSKCPSYIGVSGIVIQESRNMFVLITPEDQVKRIPKKHSVFSIVLGKFVFSIHGNHFNVKPGDRAGKKFKTKASIDL